jgi:hypothetical protein
MFILANDWMSFEAGSSDDQHSSNFIGPIYLPIVWTIWKGKQIKHE